MVRYDSPRLRPTGFFSDATIRFSHILPAEPRSEGPAYTRQRNTSSAA